MKTEMDIWNLGFTYFFFLNSKKGISNNISGLI